MSFKLYQNVPVYENYKGFSDKPSYNHPIIVYSVYLKNSSIGWNQAPRNDKSNNQIILNKHTGIKPWSPKLWILLAKTEWAFLLHFSGHYYCQRAQKKTTKSCIWWHLDHGQYLVNFYWLIISEIDRCKKVCLVCVSRTLQGHQWKSN